MAFKRSGVRLPLAPPVKLLSLPHFFDRELLIYWPYRTGEARGKHKAPDCPPSSSRTIPPKPTVATAESRRAMSRGSGARLNRGTQGAPRASRTRKSRAARRRRFPSVSRCRSAKCDALNNSLLIVIFFSRSALRWLVWPAAGFSLLAKRNGARSFGDY